MSNRNFFAELKRRNVYKVAVAYAVVSWLLIQIATQVFPFFEIPNWAVRLVVLLLILGFPVALILSWAFELTPEGIKRESDVEPGQSVARPHRPEDCWPNDCCRHCSQLDCSPSNFCAPNQVPTRVPPLRRHSALPPEVLRFCRWSTPVVIPANEYFSDGLSEELIAVLAKIPDLKVIGRSSSFLFKGKSDDSKTIGEKLGVANLIEGSVRKQGDRVRIVAELINAA